ncbi:uncharacterized protein SPAPADRAFT_63187 [Spathaspora passalidarum NRRL Y-27907]|uniref:Uncharacterized protein n=1 Tax=Spathaspora passalidarum (strain NRRL Y-27907 / 11-Y1) TaxID=619300 RepID=G3ATV3_SPAPN|nr:uncharacterized protein SPAPADRAFT_63187 [Spathaspora passalidarum NRRL Y-27907]EGW30329.1 hypothetical protein SPAPADRAFT_63187 [Spathaspora passalidarum NRRL Y-27907]
MKFSKATVLAFAALALAAPAAKRDDGTDCSSTSFHGHHKHKRAVVYDYAYVTVTVDSNGKPINVPTSTLVASVVPPSADAIQPESSAPAPSSSAVASSSAAPAPESSSAPAPQHSSAPAPVNSGIQGDLSPYQSPSEEFPDGVYSCDTFPAGQGVIALDQLGFGGWSGIYHSDTSTGGSCTEGAYCSYACQSGMSKTQWPDSQPANGVSVGGLLCKGGKLYKSNSRSNYLCEWGVDKASVVSNLDQTVAICRTDYPGTENMVIPTVVGGGQSSPITVVDQSSYYRWQGGLTSAQYYVNNAGVDWQEGCAWGSSGSGLGNWAPLNFGAGYDNGIAYLSLIPNPNNRDSLNFNVKIVAEEGSTVSGQCVYENGQYNGNGADGCTVGVTSGKADFVLY